jgi:hypothetical protein
MERFEPFTGIRLGRSMADLFAAGADVPAQSRPIWMDSRRTNTAPRKKHLIFWSNLAA